MNEKWGVNFNGRGTWSIEHQESGQLVGTATSQQAAALIAAAPDLLEACKMLVKSLTILQNSSILLKNVELNSVKAADAAIAKAEGRTP